MSITVALLQKYYEKAQFWKPNNKIDILFIAESPPHPKNGEARYFYFDKVQKFDYLLQNICEVIFNCEYEKKKKPLFLRKLQEKNIFLIDACSYPINHIKDDIERDLHVLANYPLLKKSISKIVNNDTQIILIKKNIYEQLFDKLKNDGFNVINTELLPFPSRGNQPKFKEKLRKLFPQKPELETGREKQHIYK